MLEKYCRVASWYVSQHPVMFVVLVIALLGIALMVYNATKVDIFWADYPEEE